MQQRTTNWGATQEQWDLFAGPLGLREDLLPVVSRPDATISPASKMASLGKTPSTFNSAGHAVGIPKWTQHQSTERDIRRWRSNPDHGICVQTRAVRAIDIDIDDEEMVGRITTAIELQLDLRLPVRYRVDSYKCLLPLRLEGEYGKRIIRTDHGAIEFLATGQQFIAAGTHPKGARYEWALLEEGIPVLTPAQFEGVWAMLAEHFATESGASTGRRPGLQPLIVRNADDINDPVVSFLQSTGWIREWQRDGRIDVRCPWESEHTTDTGHTSTSWFPAGVGGFAQGHFRCLHAHCEHRTDQEFLEASGYMEAHFEVVSAAAPGQPPQEGQEPAPMPVFKRDRKGRPVTNVHNMVLACSRADVVGSHVAYDAFKGQVVIAPLVQDIHQAQWRAMRDTDYTTMRAVLERKGFESVGREVIRDAVHRVAEDNTIDTAIEWLEHRTPEWDGVDRVTSFWSTYYGAEDTPYTRAVGVYAWTALAGRVLEPGCKVDMVPVLISGEGTGKTSGVAALSPSEEFFAQLRFDAKDDDLARAMRGTLVGEIAELRGLHTRDREAILDWITRRHERWTPKYQEFETTFPRRLLMIGTTNEVEFLDDTGAEDRRFLPLMVGATDLQALERDRAQLWAQARDTFKAGGVRWQDANRLGSEVRSDHRAEDPWTEPIRAWLLRDEMDEDGGPSIRALRAVRSTELFESALNVRNSAATQVDQRRLAKVMRALGFVRKVARFGDKVFKAYVATDRTREKLQRGGVDDLV